MINWIIINCQLNLESQYLQQHPKLLNTSNSHVFTDSNANTLDTWDIWFLQNVQTSLMKFNELRLKIIPIHR